MHNDSFYNFPFRPSDTSKIDWVVKEIRRGHYDGTTMECFNRQEAEELLEYVERHHPGIRAAFSWLAPSPGGWLYTSAWKHKAGIAP